MYILLTHPQQIYLEILTCQTLNHPNIIKVFGIYENLTDSHIITPWMKNGNICKYLPDLKRKATSSSEEDIVALGNAWVSTCVRVVLYSSSSTD